MSSSKTFLSQLACKDLANVTNQFMVSFSVFGSFFITKTGQDWGRVLCKLWQGMLKINHMKNPSFRALQNPLPKLSIVRCRKTEHFARQNHQFGRVYQIFTGCAKILQGVRKSPCTHRPSRFFSRIVIFPFYSFCNR